MRLTWLGMLAWIWWLQTAHAEPVQSSNQAIEPWGDAASGDGLAPRFLRWLAAQSGLQLRQDIRPLPRVVEDLKSGQNALALITASTERDGFGLEVCRPTAIRLSVIYRDAGRTLSLADLQRRPVGILRGTHTLDRFLAESGADRVFVRDLHQGFRMLRAGRLDAMMCVRPGCGHTLRELSTPADKWAELPISSEPMAVYVSRAHPLAHDAAMLDRLRAACASPQGKQELAALLARYD
ncbi:substrate-binding periplasmic protein [Chromobacterium amazonense]|uniref:substrate-binding periplasmic protein n=1 Tax=Chromobacterium amazonense TaxID=1382803 RepID=UPI000AFC3E30|nr:transporter substrate-binding domain-containing protein [Chromobacterium amazonense]